MMRLNSRIWLGILFCGVVGISPLRALNPIQIPSVQCTSYFSEHLNRSVPYCIHRSRSGQAVKGERVGYFFHGMMGTAATWETQGYASALVSLMKWGQNSPMTFVSFDTDEDSFFSDYAGEVNNSRSYETWFLKEFMPMIERTYHVCQSRECRAAIGVSMGGFGALKIALKHPELFSVAAANCPALPPSSLFQPSSVWRDYFNRHPVGSFMGMMILSRIKEIFPSEEVYKKNSPPDLVANFPASSHFPALYFDVGGNDYFGFQEGAQQLKKVLTLRKFAFETYYDPKAAHDIFLKRNVDALKFVLSKTQ